MSKQHYSRALIIAIVLHLGLLAILLFDVDWPTRPKQVVAKKTNVDIVKAVTVDAHQVEAEVARIRAQQQAKRLAEQARQQQLLRQAALAKAQRLREQKRLRQLQQRLKKAERQRLAKQRKAEKRLKQLRQKQQVEQRRLVGLKKLQQQLKAKQRTEAKRKAVLAAQRKAAAERRQAEAARQQLEAKQRAAKRAQSAAMQSEIDTYKALVISSIQNQWNYPDNVDASLSCRLKIRVAPGGKVMDVKVVESSGNRVLDRSAEIAVYKASPLPVPTEPQLFEKFRELNLRVRPQGKV